MDPHSIPYQVALLNTAILTTKGVYAAQTCGASLISPNFVLTGNKTALQPVSRPVKRVHYFEGWVECAKSLWCQALPNTCNTDRLKKRKEKKFEKF